MTEIANLVNVEKSFGKKVVLKNINIKIPRGKIVGLVGPNGAGKTTLMKMLLGIIPADRGEIFVHNQKVIPQNHKMLSKVGALIEYPDLYPFLTGYDHLKMYSRKNDFKDIIQRLGMQSYINKKSKSYSLGMKQKLGVAIALTNHPDFLILDEPMNGLDPVATKELRQLIKELNQMGVTLLISSHVLSELEKVIDRVMLLNNGKIVLNDAMDVLKKKAVKKYAVRVNRLEVASEVLTKMGKTFTIEENEIIFSPKDELELDQILKSFIKEELYILDVKSMQEDLEHMMITEINSEEGAEK